MIGLVNGERERQRDLRRFRVQQEREGSDDPNKSNLFAVLKE